MKKLISTLTVLFIVFTNSAQNWLPLNINKTYHYNCDTTNTVFSLWIDSFSIINSDTTYYTNRFILPCDTCNIANYPNLYATRFLLKNQPVFLRREIVKNNYQLKLLSPDSIVISLNLNVGNNWIFNSILNKSATVYYKGLGQILGIEDSLYCFKIDNSDTIIISKNYGIVQYPCDSGGYYRLIGIEGTDTVGYHIPDYYEIYDFPNGAIFELLDREGYPEYSDYTSKTLRINERIINTDGSYNYKISGCSFLEHYSYPQDYYYETDSFEYVSSPNFFYSYHIENYPIITFKSYQDTLYSSDQKIYYIVNIYLINGITYFEQQLTQYYKLNESYYYPNTYPDILADYYEYDSIPHGILIIEKSGLIYNSKSRFEYDAGVTTNSNINNDPNGLQCSCCIVSADNIFSKLNPKIYYNEGYVYINGIESGVIELLSSIGQILHVNNFKGVEKNQSFVYELNKDLSSGIYFIKISSNNNCETIKLLISD
ncbi:MAG: hypothetical protein A2046_00610 [Bacteroidetes bacterium GWA2_30_7]|nr:MAG: hypothetical protein A2046_00610 [Bacteroidetes bacterium GWA2_30_7]